MIATPEHGGLSGEERSEVSQERPELTVTNEGINDEEFGDGDTEQWRSQEGNRQHGDGDEQRRSQASVSEVWTEVGAGQPLGRPDVRGGVPVAGLRVRTDDAPGLTLAARAAAPDEVGGDPCGGLAPGDESLPLAANVDPLPGSADAERRIAAAAPDALRERVESLREVSAAATSGPWEVWDNLHRDPYIVEAGGGPLTGGIALCNTRDDYGGSNAALIVAAVNLVRALLDDPALAGRPTDGEA